MVDKRNFLTEWFGVKHLFRSLFDVEPSRIGGNKYNARKIIEIFSEREAFCSVKMDLNKNVTFCFALFVYGAQ